MASGRPTFIFDMDGTLVDNMAFHVQAWFMFFVAVATSHAPHELQALPAVIQVIADYRDVHPASILERLQRGKEAA